MAAVTNVQRLLSSLKSKGIMDDLLATAMGIVDFELLTRKDLDLIWMAKNIGVPILKLFGMELPDWLVYESEGQLGMLIMALLKK